MRFFRGDVLETIGIAVSLFLFDQQHPLTTDKINHLKPLYLLFNHIYYL